MSPKDRKFKRFFRPKLGDLQKKKKKKKRSSPKFRAIFLPKFRKFKRLRGGSFRMGGAIFHFLQKIGLKSTKNMRFCILHNPMGGGSSPPRPPPGYATACSPVLPIRENRFIRRTSCGISNAMFGNKSTSRCLFFTKLTILQNFFQNKDLKVRYSQDILLRHPFLMLRKFETHQSCEWYGV